MPQETESLDEIIKAVPHDKQITDTVAGGLGGQVLYVTTDMLSCRADCKRCALESYAVREAERRKELEALRELSDKATAGGWSWGSHASDTSKLSCIIAAETEQFYVANVREPLDGQAFLDMSAADADFMLACVNFVRALLDKGTAAGKQVEGARK